MYSVKGKKWNRRLSFLLVLVLLFGDSSLQHVMAAETGTVENQITEHRVETEVSVSGGNLEQTPGPVTEPVLTAEPEQTPDIIQTPMPVPTPASVSGNVPPRQPENYYQDPEPENYGTLAAYDAYSRTYHIDGDRYVTVIGYDGNSYLDEDGNLQQADNTLVPQSVKLIFGESP